MEKKMLIVGLGKQAVINLRDFKKLLDSDDKKKTLREIRRKND